MFQVSIDAASLKTAAKLAYRIHKRQGRAAAFHDSEGVVLAVYGGELDDPSIRLLCSDTRDGGVMSVVIPNRSAVASVSASIALDLNLAELNAFLGAVRDGDSEVLASFDEQISENAVTLTSHGISANVRALRNSATMTGMVLPSQVFSWTTVYADDIVGKVRGMLSKGSAVERAKVELQQSGLLVGIRSNVAWNRDTVSPFGDVVDAAERGESPLISVRALHAITDIAEGGSTIEIAVMSGVVLTNRYLMFRSGNAIIVAAYRKGF
jgi:hypothetical protein